MEKNVSLRTASGLFILVLLTTCIIGATFAKYTTTGNASDTARVAKWGVTISMSSDDAIFSSSYTKEDAAVTSMTNSVVAAANSDHTQDKIVAPGTTGQTEFTITGTPEVAFKLNVAVEETCAVKVAKSEEAANPYIMTEGEFEDAEVKVKLSADYEPIKFKIEKKQDASDTSNWISLKIDDAGNIVDDGSLKAEGLTLGQLETALESLSKVYEANTVVDATYRITWEWPFITTFGAYEDGEDLRTYADADVLDTYLGNEVPAQQEKYRITLTAEQID